MCIDNFSNSASDRGVKTDPNRNGSVPSRIDQDPTCDKMTLLVLRRPAINVAKLIVSIQTDLGVAVLTKNEAAAKSLIAKGADVNRSDTIGCPPLHYAAFIGDTALVVLLLVRAKLADFKMKLEIIKETNKNLREVIRETMQPVTVAPEEIAEMVVKRVKMEMEETSGVLLHEEKLALIDLVASKRAVWDESERSYKDPFERAASWKCIANDMNAQFSKTYDTKVLQAVFKNLRDTYVKKRRHLKDQMSKCSGAAASENVRRKNEQWMFWKPLQFLEPSVDTGVRFCNVADEDDYEAITVVDDIESVESSTEDSAPQVLPLRSISNVEKQRKKTTSTKKTSNVVEGLITALKSSDGDHDKYDTACMNLAHTLRELANVDEAGALFWKVKLDELQLEAAKDLLRLRNT